MLRVGVNGILNINKPPGCTSFDIVARIRRLTAEKRVGHAGTLDPAAAGVLPVFLGQATRLTDYLHDYPKEYIAVIRFGASTDTFDGEGTVTGGASPDKLTLPVIENALKSFQGVIYQTPPAYSAIKVNGMQSYKLARAGISVPHQPRQVTIDSIEVLGFELPQLKIKIGCSKGTYIRSLANDLGEALGCGAYLESLLRSAYGPFSLEDSLSLEAVDSACSAGRLESLLYPPDYPLLKWRRQAVDASTALEIGKGHDVNLDGVGPADGGAVAAYNPEGRLIAILKFVHDTGLWHPQKVFNL